MRHDRRPYHRETEAVRREALITATLELVAEGGLKAATVRAIADRAGVTPGLIRHYFSSHAALLRASSRAILDRLLAGQRATVAMAPADPMVQLATCIVTTLRPPNMEQSTLLTWAGFLPLIRSDPSLRDEDGLTYGGYRDLIEGLIRALPSQQDNPDVTDLVTACNAVIDGLWLEGCLQPETWSQGQLQRIGLDAIGAILGLDLKGCIPES